LNELRPRILRVRGRFALQGNGVPARGELGRKSGKGFFDWS
jgi:hypothetical protein